MSNDCIIMLIHKLYTKCNQFSDVIYLIKLLSYHNSYLFGSPFFLLVNICAFYADVLVVKFTEIIEM